MTSTRAPRTRRPVPVLVPDGSPEPSEPGTWTLAPAPRPLEPLALEVTLNGRDASVILELADLEYRTPAQQVGWIVAQWLRINGAHSSAPHGNGAAHPGLAQPSNGTARLGTAAPPTPEPAGHTGPIPVYHVGDGSAGSGCGRVGLFFTRPIAEGSTIRPGDVLRLDGTPLTSGGLICGHCQAPFTMSPRNWRQGTE